MTRNKFVLLLLCLVLAGSLSGCIDLKQEIWLNPDGSGKTRIKVVMVSQPDFFKIPDKSNPVSVYAQTKVAIYNELAKAKGIRTWKDVSYQLRKDGLIEFNAVGYFDNFTGVKLYLQNFGEDSNKLNLSFEGKKMLLVLDQKGKKDGTMFQPSGSSKYLPAKTLEENILQQRFAYQQIRPLIRASMETLRHDITLNLPCTNLKANNFKVLGPGKAQVVISGKELLDVIEANLFDDKKAATLLKGKNGELLTEPSIEKINQMVFGKEGPVDLRCDQPGPPLFDYQKEISTLPATIDPILKTLKIDPKELPLDSSSSPQKAVSVPPSPGGALKTVKLGGIRQNLIGEDPASKLKPFDQTMGVSVAVLVNFGGSVLKTDRGAVDKIISDDGENLVSDNEWERDFWSPRLNETKDAAQFEVFAKTPSNPKSGIKEISGKVRYSVAKGTKEVDLGKVKTEPGFEGKSLGLLVEKKEKGYSSDTAEQFTFKLKVGYDMVKEMVFTGPDGKVIPARNVGWGGGEEEASFSYEANEAWPKTVSIKVVLFDNITPVESPFTLKDIPLLPR